MLNPIPSGAQDTRSAVGVHVWLVQATLGFLLLVSGCASSKDADEGAAEPRPALSEQNAKIARGSLAAVEINGASEAAVTETVESVFTQAGFRINARRPEEIVFDRSADRRESRAYGNWMGTEVRIRMNVEIIPQNSGRYLVICRSFVACDAGTMGEDEQPLARRRVRDYEPLLYEVANRLN